MHAVTCDAAGVDVIIIMTDKESKPSFRVSNVHFVHVTMLDVARRVASALSHAGVADVLGEMMRLIKSITTSNVHSM